MVQSRLNPITVEIIGNSLASIADEILVGLIKSAYSTNIKERQDCSSVIMDALGRVVCISDMSLPMHLSSFMFTGEALLRRSPQGDPSTTETCSSSTTPTAEAPPIWPTSLS